VTDEKDDESSPTIEIVQKRRRPEGSLPEIKIGYAPAGRATLEAIADELGPGNLTPLVEESSSPSISVRESFAERETLAAILAEASSEAAAATPAARPAPAVEEDADSLAVTAIRKPVPAPANAPLEILEMLTFVVRGADPARLASEALRRRFAEEHLLGRLPVASMAEVERVDVAPWTAQGTRVIRVFCKMGG
jgi:hypothetical protein